MTWSYGENETQLATSDSAQSYFDDTNTDHVDAGVALNGRQLSAAGVQLVVNLCIAFHELLCTIPTSVNNIDSNVNPITISSEVD